MYWLHNSNSNCFSSSFLTLGIPHVSFVFKRWRKKIIANKSTTLPIFFYITSIVFSDLFVLASHKFVYTLFVKSFHYVEYFTSLFNCWPSKMQKAMKITKSDRLKDYFFHTEHSHESNPCILPVFLRLLVVFATKLSLAFSG